MHSAQLRTTQNQANQNHIARDFHNPDVQLRRLCELLNDEQLESRDAFRGLVDRWLRAHSLESMLSDDRGLWRDLSEAWKPYFAISGKRAVWSTGFIPSRDALPKTPKQWAVRHFALLILNPLSDRLRGPCPRCGTYYIKKRATKIYCSRRCGNAASAERYNAKLAKAEKAALLRWAAKFWLRWTERKHPNRSFWVARRVNATRKMMRVKGVWKVVRRPITSKWVSRNHIAIERASQKAKVKKALFTPSVAFRDTTALSLPQ